MHLGFVFNSQYISKDQHSEYTERYNVLGKKINKYLQMVMRDHLKPQDKNKEIFSINDEASNYLINDE